LTASVHDVRYFAALLRGVHFSNMATVTITQRGLTVTVEEARTLLGTAFIFSEVFDEFTYHSEAHERSKRERNDDGEGYQAEDNGENEDEGDNAAFQIHLNVLIECLNIFGTAGPAAGPISANSNSFKRWKREEEDADHEGGGGRRGEGNRRMEGLITGSEKRTSMRLSYPGSGYPLTLLIAEDASGPTTTCEITTYEPEPHLDLDFDNNKLYVNWMIMLNLLIDCRAGFVAFFQLHSSQLNRVTQSSWLRDALSELDPSCEKLTFIGNPLPEQSLNASDGRRPQKQSASVAPLFRIHADGTFGSTEMDYPNDREVLETFECAETVQFTYRFGHILKTLRSLSSSTKTSLRIDEDGLLSLQFLMPSPKPREQPTDAFIEFRVSLYHTGRLAFSSLSF
ncbi:Rad1-domain-containing protein, partial [Coprinopsis marcescibilis]